MLLPYASDRQPKSRPTLTWSLLVLLTLFTVVVVRSDHWNGRWHSTELLQTFGIVPSQFSLLSLFTYPFVHESFGHLLFNLFYLWVFGAGVEEAVGKARYMLLFLAGSAVGGGLQTLVTLALLPSDNWSVPIVGASAGCAALMGLYAVRYYRDRLDFVGLPFRPHVVAVAGLFLCYEMGVALLDLFTGAFQTEVAHWAHVGGFIFGLATAQAMRLGDTGERAYLVADAKKAMVGSLPGVAIKQWEKLLAQEPDNVLARVELARSWLLMGDREQSAEQYLYAIRLRLTNNQRNEAALLYGEMRDAFAQADVRGGQPVKPSDEGLGRSSALTASFPIDQLFALGLALEDTEQFAPAGEVLRAVTLRAPETNEAETALLKVISLYVHRLDRREEGQVLLRLFNERYPHSQFRRLAEDLGRAANEKSLGES